MQLDFGIDGAALATALAMTTFTVITLRYFSRTNSSGMHFTRFYFGVEKLISVCYNGISEIADAVSGNIVELLMNLRLMKLFGEVGVATFSVYSYVNEVFLSILFALSTATVTGLINSVSHFSVGGSQCLHKNIRIQNNNQFCNRLSGKRRLSIFNARTK